MCVFKWESGSLFAGTLFCPSSHRKFSAGQSNSLKCLFLFFPDESDLVFQVDEQVIYVVTQRLSEWMSVRMKAQGLFFVLFCRSLWLDGSWRTEPWLSFPRPSEVSWCFHWLTDTCVFVWWRLGGCVWSAVCLRERGRENEFKWVSECIKESMNRRETPSQNCCHFFSAVCKLMCVSFSVFPYNLMWHIYIQWDLKVALHFGI